MRKWQSAVLAAASAIGIGLAGGSVPARTDTGDMVLTSRRGQPSGSGYAPLAFTMDGKPVKGLYPGAVKTMTITVHNPYRFDLTVRSIRGDIAGTTRRACPADARALVVRAHVGDLPVVVPARAARRVGGIPIAMPTEAPPQCARTTFNIRLSGTATTAGR